MEALRADVMNEAEFKAALAAAIDAEGRVDVLINIAGGSAGGLIADIDLDVWDRLYKLNIRSTLTACRAVLPTMRKQGKGSIVNMASISGLRGDPGWAAYNSAKAGIISLTQSLAWEEGIYGIRVNAICPGPIGSERMLATISARGLAGLQRGLRAWAHRHGAGTLRSHPVSRFRPGLVRDRRVSRCRWRADGVDRAADKFRQGAPSHIESTRAI